MSNVEEKFKLKVLVGVGIFFLFNGNAIENIVDPHRISISVANFWPFGRWGALVSGRGSELVVCLSDRLSFGSARFPSYFYCSANMRLIFQCTSSS